MKRLLLIALLTLPASGKEFPVQHPPDALVHHERVNGFRLKLSLFDEVSGTMAHKTEIRSGPFHLPAIYRGMESAAENSSPEDSFSLKALSLYRSEAFKEKPSASPATMKLIGDMQRRYHLIVDAAVGSLSSITAKTIYAVMWVECKGKIHCTSNRGAEGPMQLTAVTQRELGIKSGDAFKPKIAIQKAAEYLEANHKIFDYNWPAAILAYGIGPGKTRSYLRKRHDPMDHPYVKRVLQARMLM